MSTATQDLKAVKGRVRAIQGEIAAINLLIKNHPAKPQPGHQTAETRETWVRISAAMQSRRKELQAELKSVNQQAVGIKARLNHSPLSRVSLAILIDLVTDLEDVFATKGPTEAWDRLTELADYLEYEEAMMTITDDAA